MSDHDQDFDAVGLSILWDRLVSIANEIALALIRTAFSTIVRENYDLACVLFDADGRSLAQASVSVPVFIGTAPQTLRHMLDKFPPETLRPGDVIITNDIWMGTGHLWDVNVMRPVFRGDTIVGYVLSISHLPDIGGRGMSALNGEMYEEGLQIPINRLFRGGAANEPLFEIIRQNVRVPEQVIGDLMANVTCTEVGGRLLLELMEEYGIDDLRPLSRAIIAQSERAMRREIAAIPDGSYTHSIQVEALDAPVTLACRIDISGERLMIDFTGSSPQLRAGINVPLCYTRAMSCYSIKCLTIPSIPNNEGSVTPVEITAPPGCILNAVPPAATGARFMVGHFVAPLIFGALGRAVPSRVQADPGMMNLLNVSGRHRNGRSFATLFFSAGGLGAKQGLDGASATPAPSNMSVMPTEVWETLTSLRVGYRRLRPDSGGPGQYRRGLGQEFRIINDSGHLLNLYGLGARTEFPALGIAGGVSGTPRVYKLGDTVVHPKGHYALEPGDSITVADSGGGGWGDPLKRDPARLAADVAEGFVSAEAAAAQYGSSRT